MILDEGIKKHGNINSKLHHLMDIIDNIWNLRTFIVKERLCLTCFLTNLSVVDALFSKRNSGNQGDASKRVKSQFLQSLDLQLETPGTLVIGTTNLPQVPIMAIFDLSSFGEKLISYYFSNTL